jgi:hypothetical protein
MLISYISNLSRALNVEMAVFKNTRILKDLLIAFIKVKVRDNKDITAPIDHFPKKKIDLITKAFEIQSYPVIAERATIPTLEMNDPVSENVNEFQLSDNATWSVTDHFVKKSCVLITTLGDSVAENAVTKPKRQYSRQDTDGKIWGPSPASSNSSESFHCELYRE